MKSETIWMVIAVVMLVDASIGLLGMNRWRQLAPNLNINLIALTEGLVATAIAAIILARRWL